MEFKTKCQHNWETKQNKLICSNCKKEILKLTQEKDNADVMIGIRANGKKYTVRIDKKRYFMPEEWKAFYNNLNENNMLLFDFLIKTGVRIEEALLFKKEDLVDDVRKTIRIFVTKRKANKPGEEMGKPRTFEIATSLYNKLKNYPHGFIFISPKEENIPRNTKEGRLLLKKYTRPKSTLAYMILRNNLKQIKVKDYYNFSLHTLRKTHGMYLVVMGIDTTEVCNRLGHNYNTYLNHYGSPSQFNQPKDKKDIINILGDIYGLK